MTTYQSLAAAEQELRSPSLRRPADDWYGLDGATQARVHVQHGARRLHVDAIESGTVLLDGVFGGGVERTVNHGRGRADIDLMLAPVGGLLDLR